MTEATFNKFEVIFAQINEFERIKRAEELKLQLLTSEQDELQNQLKETKQEQEVARCAIDEARRKLESVKHCTQVVRNLLQERQQQIQRSRKEKEGFFERASAELENLTLASQQLSEDLEMRTRKQAALIEKFNPGGPLECHDKGSQDEVMRKKQSRLKELQDQLEAASAVEEQSAKSNPELGKESIRVTQKQNE